MSVNQIIIFTVLQLLNVIFSTIKTLTLTKGSKKSAVIITGIYYGYYSFIIKAVASPDNNVYFVAFITMITNFLGVFISLTLLDRIRKDRLWLMKITVNKSEVDELKKKLVENDIKFILLTTDWKLMSAIDIYSYTKEETLKIRNILANFQSIKSCIIETIKPAV